MAKSARANGESTWKILSQRTCQSNAAMSNPGALLQIRLARTYIIIDLIAKSVIFHFARIFFIVPLA